MECQGQCPKCIEKNNDHYDIEYGALMVQDTQIYYPAKCEKCGYEFKEWYNLIYVESEG